MRALELHSLDGPRSLVAAERDVPGLPDGGYLIDVAAAGVCFPDLLVTRGEYQDKPELPTVPGLEVAGVVREAAPGADLAPGTRVWASLGGGGFASVAAAADGYVFPLPGELGFVEGAALPVNFLTAVFALIRRGGVVAGETVVVLGAAGGLGSALVSVAHALGARVIAVVSTEAKAETARSAGADEVIVGAEFRRAVLDATGGRGAEVIADVVGGDMTVEAVRCCAPEGRVLSLGFTSGTIPAVPANRLLLRNVSLIGGGLGALTRWVPGLMAECGAQVTALLEKGMRPLVGHVLPLDRGAEALELLADRTALGKVVLTVEASS